MKINLSLIIIFSSALLLPYSMQADSLSKAKELMRVMEMTKNIDASMDQVEKFQLGMLDSQSGGSEGAKDAVLKVMASTREMTRGLDWEGMFGEIYASVFTEEELEGLIQFYKSPVGKKFQAKQPELMAATMQKMQVVMAKIMPKMQEDIQKAIKDTAK